MNCGEPGGRRLLQWSWQEDAVSQTRILERKVERIVWIREEELTELAKDQWRWLYGNINPVYQKGHKHN